jgi:hypothetical protein
MALIKVKTINGFDIVKDTETDTYNVVLENDHTKVISSHCGDDDAEYAITETLQSFYDIAETFSQHLSEGCSHVTFTDMMSMTELIGIITAMNYPNAPKWAQNETDNDIIRTQSFEIGSDVYVSCPHPKFCKGTIVDAIYRSKDPVKYDSEEILESDKYYDISCEFVTDDDCVYAFIKMDDPDSEE